MFDYISSIGSRTIGSFVRIGRAGVLLSRVIFRAPNVRKGFPLLLEQLYHVGVLSVAIIVVSGLFIGMVMALQGDYILSRYGAESSLGQLVALSVVRELGPVVGGLLFAGRACSALTAEIGLMRATDQLSGMEMMAVDPVHRIISPRLWAGIISLPMLVIIFNVVSIFGSYLVGVKWLGVDAGTFWSIMKSSVDFHLDVLNGLYKAACFGFVATWIAVYQGYSTAPTAEGIASSTTKTVVFASLAILGLDFVLTAMMIGGW